MSSGVKFVILSNNTYRELNGHIILSIVIYVCLTLPCFLFIIVLDLYLVCIFENIRHNRVFNRVTLSSGNTKNEVI